MNSSVILVLSCYPDIFNEFREVVDVLASGAPKLLVRSGRETGFRCGSNWRSLHGPEPFVYARSVNFGWDAAAPNDVLLCGDDVRFETPFIRELRNVAYSDDKVGIATVQFWGQSPFVCGYFKRSVIEAVGPLDERFVGYGKDDNDFCRRMEALGYRTQPTDIVKATHSGGTSFLRHAKEIGSSMEELCNINNRLFEEKWREK